MELNPKTKLEQIIELKVEGNVIQTSGRGKIGYKDKSIFLELNKLVNEEKKVFLKVLSGHKRKHRKYIMGLYM